MKVVLISSHCDVVGLGIRCLSAYLKSKGHETRILFLPSGQIEFKYNLRWEYQYDQTVLDQVVDLCKDASLIGITLMTNYFDRVVQLTRRLKSDLTTPVIWGGIHATIRPDECLEYADMACVGEGELSVLELVERIEKGEDYRHVDGLWVKNNGNIIKNKVPPLINDLDVLPYPDYDIEDHFVLDEGVIRPMTEPLLKKHLLHSGHGRKGSTVAYTIMSSRGCPHHCAYCCNDVYLRLYEGERFLRRRSPEKIVGEIKQVRSMFDFIDYVEFQDDSFFAASQRDIERFSELYKEELGLPFWCYGSPRTITEGKVKALIDAGLDHVTMGIQSASQRTAKLYNRNISNEAVKKAAKILNKYIGAMNPPTYDIILDNPYESFEDHLETLKLLIDLPRPYHVRPFSLVLFPGTSLYEKAKNDGLVTDDKKDIYRKHYLAYQRSYVNCLYYMVINQLPKPLLRLLVNRKLVWLASRRPFTTVISIGYKLRHLFQIKKIWRIWKRERILRA